MKKSKILLIGALAGLTVACLSAVIAFNSEKPIQAEGYTLSELPTRIDLNDTSATNIRSYYSSLNNLSANERKGTNLLKNLKTILKNGQKYYGYDSGGNDIWKMYEITDRDWAKSPATSISGYNSSTKIISSYTYGTSTSNKGTNPYLHALYVNRDDTNKTTAWDTHAQTDQWGINREHIWPKSQGFDDSGVGGARGDPMHLWAGNGYVNNIHNNHPYGYVQSVSTNCGDKWNTVENNLLGTSKTLGSSYTVFEPQDDDKGDIARAIFYMVARYNYYSGSDSDGIDANNPNLELVQAAPEKSSYTSTKTTKGQMGILSDLLEWNRNDPPDAWEIHRNNLLYANFTNNRNPFIDFPEWADIAWGSSTKSATPASDTINDWGSGSTISVTGVSVSPTSVSLETGGTRQLTPTISPSNATNQAVSYSSSNENVAVVNSDGLITATGAGTATITVTTDDGGKTATCSVSVTAPVGDISVDSVALSKISLDLVVGHTDTISAIIYPSNATNQNVSWSTSNANIATVNNGTITAIAEGTATITVTTQDGHKTATCVVTVSQPSGGGWVVDTDAYRTALFGESYNSTGVSSYSNSWYATNSSQNFIVDITNASNYSNNWNYIKIGHKDNAYTGTITTRDVIDKPVGKVSITIDALDAYITSLKLYWSSNSDFSNASEDSFALETGTQSVNIPSPVANMYYKIEAVCTSGGKYNGHITISQIDYYSSTYYSEEDLPRVTDISLSSENLNLDLYGSTTATLTATVTVQNGALTNVSWLSNDESVVTVENGVVTASGVGSTTVIVVSQFDESKYAECEVHVTDSTPIVEPTYDVSIMHGSPYLNGVAYRMYMYSTYRSANYYFIGSYYGDSERYGDTSTAIANGADVYFQKNGSGQDIYFYKNNVKQYISIKEVTSSGKTYYNFSIGTSRPSTPWLYQTSGDDYACMTFAANNTIYTLGTYGIYSTFGSVDLNQYTDDYEVEFISADAATASGFGEAFMESINCDATGNTAPTFNDSITWEDFENVYTKFSITHQNQLKSAADVENGTTVEKAMHRYDYMIGKYGEATFPDFIGRNPTPLTKVGFSLFSEVSQTSMTAIIVILTLVGVTSIGVIVTLKKRKEN